LSNTPDWLPGGYLDAAGADVNGDGDDDVLIAKGSPGQVAVFVYAQQPPELTVDWATVSVNEGEVATNSGTVSDPDGDTVTLSASVGTVANNGDGTWDWNFPAADGPANGQTVTISGDDGNGGTADVFFDLTVVNVAPTVANINVPVDPVCIENQPISVSAAFSDPAGTADEPYMCTFDYGDGAGPVPGTVVGMTCTGPDYTYASAGVYAVTVTVTDKDGGVGIRHRRRMD
jgi:hypothetical protein